jgi:LETM1-like protein
MLKDKIRNLIKFTKISPTNNRTVAISMDPNVTPFLQTRRFFANNPEKFHEDDQKTELSEAKIPVSQERDKVFSEKKMTLMDHVKVGLHHMKKGFIYIGRDTVYLTKILSKNQLREESYTVFELTERRRIVKDLIKFVPYSAFLLVPFAELFLPVYMILFPNSMPSQFMFESQVGKKTSDLVLAQQDAYEKIIPLLPKFANVIGLDPLKFVQSIKDILDREGKEKDRLFYKISDFESKINQFVKSYPTMSRKEKDFHSIKNMTAYELEQTAKLLCLDYIPGYNILNSTMWTFTRLPFISYNFLASHVYKLRLKRDKTLTPFIPLDFMSWRVSKFAFKFDSGPLSLVKKILLAE